MIASRALDDASLERLTQAIVALNPQPRVRRWTSLVFCIVDAVWSIGAHYDDVVVPLVRKKIAERLGVDHPTAPAEGFQARDPLVLSKLDELGVDELTKLTNRQRTSTRNGILKAEAVLQHCRVFREHGVETSSRQSNCLLTMISSGGWIVRFAQSTAKVATGSDATTSGC